MRTSSNSAASTSPGLERAYALPLCRRGSAGACTTTVRAVSLFTLSTRRSTRGSAATRPSPSCGRCDRAVRAGERLLCHNPLSVPIADPLVTVPRDAGEVLLRVQLRVRLARAGIGRCVIAIGSGGQSHDKNVCVTVLGASCRHVRRRRSAVVESSSAGIRCWRRAEFAITVVMAS